MNVLQATIQFKSQPPNVSSDSLQRPKLLSEALQQPLLWLNAPAGFGKSTFLQQIGQEHHLQGRTVVWYSVDETDDSGEQFLRQLIHSVEFQLGKTLIDSHEGWLQHVDLQQAMLQWLDFITATPQLVLILDNVHLLGSSDAWMVLLRLLELQTEQQHLYLASRYLPAALGKLHLRPTLAWLGGGDLSFNDDQVQEYLQQQKIHQAADLVPALSNLLQGWPAGLVIWLSHYKAQQQPQNLSNTAVKHLAQAALGDYLQGEVLCQLTPQLLEFLCVCAVLSRFNEDLLQQCYGNDEYHELLTDALQQRLFIRHEQHRPGWYQIHPVMARHLANKLPYQQRQHLHKKAFSLLSRDSSYSVVALHHAIEAGMTEQIQDWLLQESEQILADLDIAGLLSWFELLDDQWLEKKPRLLAIYCWSLLITQQSEAANVKLAQLKQLDYLKSYEIRAFDGYCQRLACQLKAADESCLKAYKGLPNESFTLRILMLTTLAQLAVTRQDLTSARRFNQSAMKIATQFHAPGLEALTLFYSARIHFYGGQVVVAQEEIERGLGLLASFGDSAERLPRGRLLLYQVMLQWLTGSSSEQLNETLQLGLSQCLQQRDVAICYGYAIQALMHSHAQQPQAAFKVLDTAQWLMQRWRVEPKSYQWLQIVRINVQLNHDQVWQAQQALEQLLLDNKEQGIAQSELFPLLPGLVRLTQGRILLLTQQSEACITFIDKALHQGGSVIYRALLELLRALCLRHQNPLQGQQLLSLAVRGLQKEAISSDLLHWLASLHEQQSAPPQEIPSNISLSEREVEVLRKISQGCSNQEIADQMFISLNTVKTHARKINIKLAVKNRTQALVRATELGLL